MAFIDTSSLEASFETVENQELPLLPSELVYYAWGGGVTQSRKGYQLRSNLSGAGDVASQDGYKKGGCPVIISSQRGAVVLIVNVVHQITIIFVLIIH